MARGIKVTIGANAGPFAKGLQSVNRRIAGWAARLPGRFARAGIAAGRRFVRGLVRTIRRGIIAAGVLGAGLIGKSISEAGRFEKYEMQFEALLGTVQDAQKRMNEIKEVDLEAPFDITQIADASRILTVFTANAFAGTEALRMMADAAAVTPRPLSEIAYWYGRAYSMIKANRPLGEAIMRLTEMGLLSAEASIQLQKLSKSYTPASQEQKLAIINAEFRKFEGSAAKLVTTWPGIWSVFTSATKQAFAAVGDAILPLAKIWLQDVIDKMTELRNDGTLTQWGANVSNAFWKIRNSIEASLPRLQSALSAVRSYISSVFESLETGTFGDKIGKDIKRGIAKAGDGLADFFNDERVRELSAAAVEFGGKIGWYMLQGISQALKNVPILGHELKRLENWSENAGKVVGAVEQSGIGKSMAGRAIFDAAGVGLRIAKNPAGAAIDFGKAYRQNAKEMVVYIADISEPAKEKISPTPKGGM